MILVCFDAQVVRKTLPGEKVGVVCVVDGKHEVTTKDTYTCAWCMHLCYLQVVEYSEISPAVAELRNKDGSLTFSAGNICNHYFTMEFLEGVCLNHCNDLIHHVAKKKITYVNEQGVRSGNVGGKNNTFQLCKPVVDTVNY